MKISLDNKKAFVGGSSKGIGKAIATQLANSGASVTIVGRNSVDLEATLASLRKDVHQQHQLLVVDYNDLEQYKTIVSDYFAKNKVDILVNNTNGPKPGAALENKAEDFQTAFNLLFQVAQFTTQCSMASMLENGFGRIINVCSVTAKEPLPNLVLSNSIRAALLAWAKTLATAVAANNITVNNVLTGYFDTERFAEIVRNQSQQLNVAETTIKANIIATIPAKRLGKPEEYGQLVTFLASDYASYLTGCSIPLDGGYLKGV